MCATAVEVVVGIQSLQIPWLGKPCSPSLAYRPFKGTDPSGKNIYLTLVRLLVEAWVELRDHREKAQTQLEVTKTEGKTKRKEWLGAGSFPNRCHKET